MMQIDIQKSFKKDLKRIRKSGFNLNLLDTVIELLCKKEPLPAQYNDHILKGNYIGYRECHITPDWLLIYKITNGNKLTLVLSRTGSHSDLF